ncbi:TfoX/Sxy family protein [Shinella kummerowiae]|uniref:TfoX/Sxy family protein n=1 Tax=Shinella kummerowiae TaxID=417745 RepID=UPI0021B4FE67|nr:TfoX/Sxy family protein [Shinella kummerowiae]MCT7663644.1 TfoX/Sxy family protein [Shinella kummerowiae]
MARDGDLEDVVRADLGFRAGLSERTMFGGLAWLLDGKLLCGARKEGMLVRLGKGNDAWALETAGIAQMIMGDRVMEGWVRASPEACTDAVLRRRLISEAVAFVDTLPPK